MLQHCAVSFNFPSFQDLDTDSDIFCFLSSEYEELVLKIGAILYSGFKILI